MTSRRVSCLVPFCRHTRGDRKGDPLPRPLDGYEWICAEHWRGVPGLYRRVYRKRRRAERSNPADDALRVRASRIWSARRRAAIEAAAGIAS